MDIVKSITELRILGEQRGFALYNICFRGAGVGIQWHPQNPGMINGEAAEDWRTRLVLAKYYPSLSKAIQGEIARLSK